MKHVRELTTSDEQFLMNRLTEEWRAAERAERRHEVAKAAKAGGVILAKSLLAFSVLAGVLTIAAVAPNAFAAYGKLFGNPSRRFYEKEMFKREVERLRRRGFVRARKTPRGYEVEATEKGRTRAIREAVANLAIRTQEKWDGTWWLVTFDIPRRKNAERDAIRERLKHIGMEPLQESVFISRYPCADEVWFTARRFFVDYYITIAHVDALEGYGERLAGITDRRARA